jgi:molybdenum cofactor biosynthesis enzyme MoaA
VFPTVSDLDLINLKVLQMAGGEPLLIKENFDLLERLSRINPGINIEITTNLTSIQKNRIYQLPKSESNKGND